MGLQQLREHNQQQAQIRNENVKKYQEALRKKEEAKKQKLIDANENARRSNEAHAEKLNADTDIEYKEPKLIIKKTSLQK